MKSQCKKLCKCWYSSKVNFSYLHQGFGLLSQWSPFRYYPNFSALSKRTLAIEYHITIISDRCRRSSAAVAPAKYKCDSNNLRGIFARSKIFLTEKLTNRALVTPTPDQSQRIIKNAKTSFSKEKHLCTWSVNQVPQVCNIKPHNSGHLQIIYMNLPVNYHSQCITDSPYYAACNISVSKIRKNIYRSDVQITFELYGHFRC